MRQSATASFIFRRTTYSLGIAIDRCHVLIVALQFSAIAKSHHPSTSMLPGHCFYFSLHCFCPPPLVFAASAVSVAGEQSSNSRVPTSLPRPTLSLTLLVFGRRPTCACLLVGPALVLPTLGVLAAAAASICPLPLPFSLPRRRRGQAEPSSGSRSLLTRLPLALLSCFCSSACLAPAPP